MVQDPSATPGRKIGAEKLRAISGHSLFIRTEEVNTNTILGFIIELCLAYMCELQKTGVGSLRSANFKIVSGSANFCDRGGSGGGTEIFLTTKNLP